MPPALGQQVNLLLQMAGGQCPLKRGALTATAAVGDWSID